MTDMELQRRRLNLLAGGRLKAKIAEMIKAKSLDALCESVTAVASRSGGEEIVVRLLAADPKGRIAKISLWIPDGVYADDRFGDCDGRIGRRIGDADDRTLLRALRTAFDAISAVTSGERGGEELFARAREDGSLEWRH